MFHRPIRWRKLQSQISKMVSVLCVSHLPLLISWEPHHWPHSSVPLTYPAYRKQQRLKRPQPVQPMSLLSKCDSSRCTIFSECPTHKRQKSQLSWHPQCLPWLRHPSRILLCSLNRRLSKHKLRWSTHRPCRLLTTNTFRKWNQTFPNNQSRWRKANCCRRWTIWSKTIRTL